MQSKTLLSSVVFGLILVPLTVAATTIRVGPIYPEEALRKCLEGYVQVEFTVTADGRVDNVVIIDSDPPGVFEEAALEAMKRWSFAPRAEDGIPVSMQKVQTTIKFDIADPEKTCSIEDKSK